MRALLGLVVADGTGRQAQAQGYLVGGKTGTAEKAGAGGYRRKALLSSFVAAFPINDPRYVVFVALDEPKGTERTFNFASAGWTAAPTTSRIVGRIAPLLGVAPATNDPAATDSILVSVRKGR
jgi:cell division protein FtsI (penicillin-binding protein 3)